MNNNELLKSQEARKKLHSRASQRTGRMTADMGIIDDG